MAWENCYLGLQDQERKEEEETASLSQGDS